MPPLQSSDSISAPERAAPSPNQRRLRRLSTSGRRWRRAWSGERLRDVGRTLVWVVPLTLLIWIWAQDQQIDQVEQQSVAVGLDHIDSSRIVTVLSGGARGAGVGAGGRAGTADVIAPSITFQGPRIGLSTLLSQLRASSPGEPLLELRLRTGPVDSTAVNLRDELNANDVLRDAGVSVVETRPAEVLVRVEPRGQITARIVPSGEGGLQPEDLAGPVAFEPAQVTVQGPATALEQLPRGADGQPTVLAELPDDAPAGVKHTLAVSLSPADPQLRVSLSTKEAQATFTRKERRVERLELASVPVRIDKPVPMEQGWRVELAESGVLNKLTVQGPAETIAQIRRQIDANEQPVYAVLRVEREDEFQEDGTIRRRVEMRLPAEVTLVGEPPEVGFTLRRLSSE